METPLSILYTANLRGQIHLLPRLYTWMRRQQPAGRRAWWFDLGAACAPAAWHCAATGGRSMLIVLDAMGYHAANVTGYLTPEGRARLDANLLKIALVDEAHGWGDDTLSAACAGDAPPGRLLVLLTPAAQTCLDGHRLSLAAVQAGQVGITRLESAGDHGALTLAAHTVHDLPPDTLPDPTISATVDFVLSEARLFQRRQP
jgi:hypothetical protein